jgi:ribonucleoside-diphosphate reductase alpha chain
MPEDATVEDIEQIHIDSWKMGLKAVAIYRDNCKVAQPLSMAKKDGAAAAPAITAVGPSVPATPAAVAEQPVTAARNTARRPLPRVRNSRTYKFQIADLEGYFTVGEYDDGAPGELFINVSKQGSTLSGLMDSFAISVSHGLQFGVPLKSYVKTMRGTSFAPSGITDDGDIRTASSITDYIFRRLALDYLSFDDRLELGLASLDDMPEIQTALLETAAPASVSAPAPAPAEVPEPIAAKNAQALPKPPSPPVNEAPAMPTADAKAIVQDATAPLCYNCGNQTQRAGSCYVCSSCGSTTGCS